MEHYKRLFSSFMAILLIFASTLFPGSSIKKEIRVYDSFENYTVDKPFKVYFSEEEYNKDTAIKDDPTYIKQIKTIHENDPTKNRRQEIVPWFYIDQYNAFNDIDNPYRMRLKRVILLFDSVDALKKNAAVKIYSSDKCVSEMESDINTRFKRGKNFIKIIYRYDRETNLIWCQLHMVPKCHLTQYLYHKISQGMITPLQAVEIERTSDEEKYLWYGHDDKYMNWPGKKVKDQPGKKYARDNIKSPSKKEKQKTTVH